MKRYRLYVTPAALKEIKKLPGNVRQRVKKAVQGLADDPHPSKSRKLQVPGLDSVVCRLRIDNWRIVYAVTEVDEVIDVLAVRKRPPYDYGDLESLVERE